MTLGELALSNTLQYGATKLAPLIAQRTNAEILRWLPSVEGLSGLLRSSSLPGRDSLYFFLNLLRHSSKRSPDEIKEQIQRYIINPVIASEAARAKAMKQLGFRGLSSLIISPTVACNLRCEHCYNLYEIHERQKDQLSLDSLTRVVGEARSLGAYRLTVIGGEPLLRWKDLASIAKTYPDVLLTIFTNGLLLTADMSREMASLGNIELAFSIDGLEASHDQWRGMGTWRKTLDAMRQYADAGGMVVAAPTVTSENYREILSDELLSTIKKNGAYMAYIHHYDLVGGQARVDWLLTPDQLSWMKRRIADIHQHQDIFILSNVTSDIVRGGCPAVRDFVHVNHKGEVEPCCMVPFAAESIHQKSLQEILAAPFLTKLRKLSADQTGIKRCLIAENFPSIKEELEQERAFGTTKESKQHMESHATENQPTCFSIR